MEFVRRVRWGLMRFTSSLHPTDWVRMHWPPWGFRIGVENSFYNSKMAVVNRKVGSIGRFYHFEVWATIPYLLILILIFLVCRFIFESTSEYFAAVAGLEWRSTSWTTLKSLVSL